MKANKLPHPKHHIDHAHGVLSSIHHGHGLYDAWDEAVYLLSHVLNLDLSLDRSMLLNVLSKDEVAEVRRLFRERSSEKMPSAYLTSRAWFCGLPFLSLIHI